MMRQILGAELPELILMVGPSGAGKSKIANEIGYPIVSTDKIRQNLFGLGPDGKISAAAYKPDGFRNTFAAAEYVVEGYLRAGQSVIYDATNLTGHDRVSFLLRQGFFAGESPTQARVTYYVVNRPLAEKLESYKLAMCFKQGVPHTSEDIIRRHDQKFRDNEEFLMSNKDTDKVKITIRDLRT
jgi:hypothetical protein